MTIDSSFSQYTRIYTVMQGFASFLHTEKLRVNSFHNNVIKQKNLGKNLEPFATANDNTIEGFYHTELPIIGVMWHPERTPNEENVEIIRKISSFFSLPLITSIIIGIKF